MDLFDFLDFIADITLEDDLFQHVLIYAGMLGFEFCSYFLRIPVPVSRPATAMFDNFPSEWKDRYRARNYVEIDPTIKHGLESSSAALWSDRLFHATPELWKEAQAHGLCVGWVQPTRDASGSVGILNVARSTGNISRSERARKQAQMLWLSHAVHASMSRLMFPKLIPELSVALTSREKDALRWTAEGKTAYEIGKILNVAERTIIFHLKNAVAKLGATNKTQATVKAALLGML